MLIASNPDTMGKKMTVCLSDFPPQNPQPQAHPEKTIRQIPVEGHHANYYTQDG